MAKTKEYRLYTNWFAMLFYDCTEYKGEPYKLAKLVQQILKLEPDSSEMRIEKCEVMYTSFLSEALDYFMRGVGHCCLH